MRAGAATTTIAIIAAIAILPVRYFWPQQPFAYACLPLDRGFVQCGVAVSVGAPHVQALALEPRAHVHVPRLRAPLNRVAAKGVDSVNVAAATTATAITTNTTTTAAGVVFVLLFFLFLLAAAAAAALFLVEPLDHFGLPLPHGVHEGRGAVGRAAVDEDAPLVHQPPHHGQVAVAGRPVKRVALPLFAGALQGAAGHPALLSQVLAHLQEAAPRRPQQGAGAVPVASRQRVKHFGLHEPDNLFQVAPLRRL
mmetsp:Transcript_59371/g.116482  ORF Transcript_59371/g.116482 Transcript_59371/m.116482 type:complete len:252 (+) Transcript_59371:128-883(+)